MTLQTAKIDNEFDEILKIEQLAKEAFPPEEYLAPSAIIEMASTNNIDFLALYDDKILVGFMVIKKHETMAYLFFLAIEPEQRSAGYGGKAINTIKMLYPTMEHVLDLEKLDDTADNNKQRESRRQFYIRNGYRPTGKFLRYFGVEYEIMSMNDEFDFEQFKKLMNSMEIEGFEPIYFTE